MLQVGLHIETSAVCIAVLQFGQTGFNLAFVANFNFIFSIGQQFRAGRYKIPHLQQYLPVVSHFMRVQTIISILLFASLSISCNQKTRTDSDNVKFSQLTLVDIVDEVSPPPPDLTSKFKTMQEWLLNLCDDMKPKNPIENYEFGLFESPEEYTMYLVGVNKYDKGDTSYTRIQFEPVNMYFPLPKGEYENLNREELLNRLISQLKDFADTEKFKASFFTQANKITFASNGQKIWSKSE